MATQRSSNRRTNLMRFCALGLVLALIAGLAYASGSSRGGVTAGPTGPATTDPFLVTHVVKATVVGVDLDAGTFTVRDLKTEELREVKIHGDLKMRAKNKKAFGGRRNLEPTDLAEGQLLRLTVRDADGAVVRLRVEKTIET